MLIQNFIANIKQLGVLIQVVEYGRVENLLTSF